jgi:single-strand DNA-binding protein
LVASGDPAERQEPMKDVHVIWAMARLGADPELKTFDSGNSVCKMRVAWNNSKKDGDQWVDVPCWMDLVVWGRQGEACARYLHKGSQVVFTGRLNMRSWETEDGSKRTAYEIVAEQVQFDRGSGDRDGSAPVQQSAPAQAGDPLSGSGFQAPPPAAVPGAPAPATGDDDIPFLWDGPAEWDAVKAHGREHPHA